MASVRSRGRARTNRDEVATFFTRHWEAFNRRDVATLAADYLDDWRTPADVITGLNRVRMRHAVDARFATLVYGQVDDDNRLTYCNAGHNPPLLVGRKRVQWL